MGAVLQDTTESASTDLELYMQRLGQQARRASQIMAQIDPQTKNAGLSAIADRIDANRKIIQFENARDLQQGRKDNLSAAMLDRLELTSVRIDAMVEGLRQVIRLPDPIGEISDLKFRPSGIQIGKMRVPLGVIGIIYESRPNVTIDAAALCLKSGNASILRGGKEAIHSNQAIYRSIEEGLLHAGLPKHAVQVVNTTERAAVGYMLDLSEFIDIIIPRGGKSLIERISNDSKIPVIKHLDGNCHVYIDDNADQDKALKIAINAKTRRYGVCNAMETLLIAEQIAGSILPEIEKELLAKKVEMRGCEKTRKISRSKMIQATEEDWYTEYVAPILAIKLVGSLDQAIDHINRYGSQHTDAIVTEDLSRAREFLRRVDSSSVMVNASTAFADGFEYGLGAEIGISTDKLHARGPVGLEGLTSQKYIVFGDGHIRA